MGEKLTCLVSSGFLLVSIENWLFNSSIFIWGDFITEKTNWSRLSFDLPANLEIAYSSVVEIFLKSSENRSTI